MAKASSSPTQLVISPGFLITHDWKQIHTNCQFCDPVIQKLDSSIEENYHTAIFPITSTCQYQAFVNGLGHWDVQSVSCCPLRLVPDDICHTCSDRPLSAVVKLMYHVTHIESAHQHEAFSADAQKALHGIQEEALNPRKVREEAVKFLQRFGSHFQPGVQKIGRYFYWIGLFEGQCNMDVLREISDELFKICDKKAAYFLASQEGEWYNPHLLLKCDSWTEDKKDVLKSLKLRVAHCGSSRKCMNLQEWRKNKVMDRLSRINDINVDFVPVWKLIRMHRPQFSLCDWLANEIEDSWNEIVHRSQYVSFYIPRAARSIGQWDILVEEYNLQAYYPGKLSLQTVRSLNRKSAEAIRKQNLPWDMLQQIILMNSHCRESSIYDFSKAAPRQNTLIARLCEDQATKRADLPPHPMDMVLLLFICSDFMLRQILALKFFMCQLAIPFIVPTPDNKVEMLLWPLRSIVVEWQSKDHKAMEEALVKCKFNMVAFIRYGKTIFSKSKMMNAILTQNKHDVFFHKEAPCGREKRLISNGTVELSHFLPSGNMQDSFKEPVLFFNLRGDICDYQVQHGILMDLATVLVIVVDVGEFQTRKMNEMLQQASKKTNIILILTNTTELSDDDIVQNGRPLLSLIGGKTEDAFVPTFEEGGPRNDADMTHHIIKAIRNKLAKSPKQALEDLGIISSNYVVDELMNSHCTNGKRVSQEIVSNMSQVSLHERKEQLLPQQGGNLHKMRKLLRDLHRNSSRESQSEKEEIKRKIKKIRENQFKISQKNSFMKKVILIFDNTETQEFAIRWLQLELDAISRTHLPALHKVKNEKWNTLRRARTSNSPCADLEKDLFQAEMTITAAACGLEHIMREMAQMYEVATQLKKNLRNQSHDVSHFPAIVARLLYKGHPTELMDGDHGVLPLEWIKAVFTSVVKLIDDDKKVFVLSIMGIQSSGKSTLLNTMFGLQLAVSAGRCTHGIYAQLLPVAKESNLPFDYMLVLDSEGLRAQGISHSMEHDNELATLIIGLADLTLINIKGESMAELKDILQITVHAFLRMNQADFLHRRQCMFIHQNVSATNVQDKLATDRQELQDQLDKMTKEASEALGLPETITAFNRVINFDCQRDVVYFSDLWHGVPPMATINQGYFIRAAETRLIILEQVVAHFSSFTTISEFPRRVQDMWYGVLADDFIFSFRNSLAAKAYIEVEQEFSKLTLEILENLSMWVNQSCNIKIQNCSCEVDLKSRIKALHISLRQKVADLCAQQLQSLKTFFANHAAKGIINQWKAEKEASLKLFCETEERRMGALMDNMRIRQVFKLCQKSTFHNHEQEIMKQAVSLAEDLRGKCPTEEELRDEFDNIWSPFENQLVADYSPPSSNVIADLEGILRHQMSSLGYDIYLHDQYKVTPDASLNTMQQQDILQEFIMVKGTLQRVLRGRLSFIEAAAKLANDMMDSVTKKVQEICEQDVMFQKLHGRQTVDLAVKKVMDHNAVWEAKFSFTPPFIAFFVVRVACYAAAHFDKMNQTFEERHGVQAKLNDYRPRVFLLFKNTVGEKAAELVLAANFCEAIKGTLLEFIRIKLDLRVRKEINQSIGTSKYDLITKVLDDFAKKRSFTKLLQYVHNPYESADSWMQQFGNNLIFGENDGQICYSKFADNYVDEIISEVRSSTEAASQVALSSYETDQSSTLETDQPSSLDINQPSAPDIAPPRASDTDQPSTPETDQPSTPEADQPRTPETDQRNTPETEQRSTPETDQRSTPDINQPSTPDINQPSIPDINQPSAGQPGNPYTDQPTTPDTNQPSAPDAYQLSAPDIYQPTTPKPDQPSTAKTDQPSTPDTDGVNTPERGKHSMWIMIFCERMKNIAPIDPASLEVTQNYKINDFAYHHKAVEQSLQTLEEDMKEEFKKTTPGTVKWSDIKSPFQKACNHLWGCRALCPLCKEPCQQSDPNHEASHHCIQHRPSGIRGNCNKETKYLSTNTCSVKVTITNFNFSCNACMKHCRKTPHCSATEDEEVFHPFLDYKKFLPDWDIAPDPASEASKFWQWVMYTFQEELLTEYKGTKLEIPDSWKDVTDKEASDSLRKYFQ